MRGINIGSLETLSQVPCPSVQLDLGFISNESDLAYLNSESYQEKIAASVFASIRDFQKSK